MGQDLKRAIEKWRLADTEARSAEHLLTQAYGDILAGRARTVPAELIDQVARVRAASNELLMEALALMKAQRINAILQQVDSPTAGPE